ncbi:MAG: histone deacetylase family protein [Gaiellaceae bacterium]
MELSMPVVRSDRCLLHEPAAEIWVGVTGPAAETPARMTAILDALDARLVEAEPHPDEALLAVHDEELLAYLASAWEEWHAADLPQEQVVPYVFAHRELGARRVPAAVWARPGWFAYDTMTLVGPGTWDAARAAADAALTAVDLVLAGEPVAYACTRPPGHHVTRRAYGGSCYLNNAAIAAEALRSGLEGPVAVLDVDAHHGNGTQEIFRGRDDVLTGSVHVDPGAGWFPHYLGFADESDGSNLNLPLAPGSGDGPWLEAVAELVGWARGASALVVVLGVDAAAGDPESPLEVSGAAFREAGRLLGTPALPTVVVQEGGYDLRALGELVREALLGLEEGRP